MTSIFQAFDCQHYGGTISIWGVEVQNLIDQCSFEPRKINIPWTFNNWKNKQNHSRSLLSVLQNIYRLLYHMSNSNIGIVWNQQQFLQDLELDSGSDLVEVAQLHMPETSKINNALNIRSNWKSPIWTLSSLSLIQWINVWKRFEPWRRVTFSGAEPNLAGGMQGGCTAGKLVTCHGPRIKHIDIHYIIIVMNLRYIDLTFRWYSY